MKRPRLSQLLAAFVVLAAVLGALRLSRATGGAARSRFASSPGVAGRAALELAPLDVAPAPPAQAGSPGGLAAMFAARKLIRTATISLAVDRYAEAADKAGAIAAAAGGYVADAQASREHGDSAHGTLTLRVRADRLDEALRSVQALGRVEASSVDAQDVSREYMDLETRLAVKHEAQARMRDLLRTRTARLADVLEAEKELSRSIEESERLEGERRYFDQQVALSTIRVEMHEPPAFFEQNAMAPLREALREALPLVCRSAAALLSGTAAVLPWALVGIVAWVVRRRLTVRRPLAAVTED